MLKQFKDYLKTLSLADYYYVGKIENSKLKVLGLYSDLSNRVEAVGKESSYEIAGFRLLIHWNRNAVETEAQASLVYESIRYISDTEMTDVYVAFIDADKPVFLGTDDNNVYEYVINGRIFYGR